MAVVTMKQLLDSGALRAPDLPVGIPKMKRFIATDRNGIHIIDLQQTRLHRQGVLNSSRRRVAHGGTIRPCAKKQAQIHRRRGHRVARVRQ